MSALSGSVRCVRPCLAAAWTRQLSLSILASRVWAGRGVSGLAGRQTLVVTRLARCFAVGGYRRPGEVRMLFMASVVTHYVDLPPNYDDETGLPFRRRGDLERAEVVQVFGPSMNVNAANRLLRILHGRRVAGTLDDPAYQIHTARYTAADMDAALAYLRKTVPVNEVVNAGLRAEDELAVLEQPEEEAEEETEIETAKPKALKKLTENKWRARLFKDAPGQDVYGVGAFDFIRARNKKLNAEREALREAEEAARHAEEERLAAERGGGHSLEAVDGQSSNVPSREMSPRMKKWAMAATSPLQEAPDMSAWQRLWPSAAFVAALLAGGGVLAINYTPPAPDRRLLPDVSPATATVIGLVAANVGVWLLWRVPPAWRVLNQYMIVVPATPRPLSLIGAMFSHQKAGHLLANAAFLWFIGIRLHDEVGRAAFLEVYMTSGALAFLTSLANIVLRNNLHLTTLGASGAIYGITTAYFILHKFEGFKVLGLPPDPYNGVQGFGFVGLMLGLNLLTMRAEKQSVDVVTHFIGMAVGTLFGEYFYAQKQEASQAAAEGRPCRSVWAVLRERVLEASGGQ